MNDNQYLDTSDRLNMSEYGDNSVTNTFNVVIENELYKSVKKGKSKFTKRPFDFKYRKNRSKLAQQSRKKQRHKR